MKYLIILCRVLLCAILLLLTLSKSAPTGTLPEAVPDTTTLSATDFAMPTLPEEYVHEDKFLEYIPMFAIAFAVILLIDTIFLFIILRKIKNREQMIKSQGGQKFFDDSAKLYLNAIVWFLRKNKDEKKKHTRNI